jgi:hypothetical protein
MSEIVYMFEDAKEGKPYDKVAYYRCVGIEDFIKKVKEKSNIVGITLEGNNLGFIVDDKK